jgi:DSBA-like thioredoxin domain
VETTTFSVTWDYRCPFARNAHEHLISALEAGAPWDVTFTPFSLSQIHIHPGDPPVWDDPAKAPDLLSMQVGIVVRDRFAEQFRAVHLGLFTARHDEGRDLRKEAVLRAVLDDNGVPADAVLAEINQGWPLEEFRAAHEDSVKRHQVFGVPTFILDGQAAFVRLMTRPQGDAALARQTLDEVLALFARPEINEFKHTSIGR